MSTPPLEEIAERATDDVYRLDSIAQDIPLRHRTGIKFTILRAVLSALQQATEEKDKEGLGLKEADVNARTTQGQNELNWIPTTERLPEVCKPVFGYADRWVDSEYNEMGMRECFRNDDEWQSAAWNNYQDCWDVEVGAPDCWMPFPSAPLFSRVTDSANAQE